MKSHETDYELGENVTGLARASRSKLGNVVLSVRLSSEELARVEAVAEEEGKTLSQVVREALRKHASETRRKARARQPQVTISTPGLTLSLGWEHQASQPNLISETRRLVPVGN